MVESLYTCYTQYSAAVCKHLVASIKGNAVSPAITKRDPPVYVEVSHAFSYLWAPDVYRGRNATHTQKTMGMAYKLGKVRTYKL